MKINHNTLAVVFPILVIIALTFLVHFIPEIGLAPIETAGHTFLKVAIFYAAWSLVLRVLGGWHYRITEEAKKTPYGMTAIACALIIGVALVVAR